MTQPDTPVYDLRSRDAYRTDDVGACSGDAHTTGTSRLSTPATGIQYTVRAEQYVLLILASTVTLGTHGNYCSFQDVPILPTFVHDVPRFI
jgi:hypothetical protein